VRAWFSPFRFLSLFLSLSLSPSLSFSLILPRTLSRRTGERKKGKTKVRAKRNAGSLTARRRRCRRCRARDGRMLVLLMPDAAGA